MLGSSTDGSFKVNISRGGDSQAYRFNPEIERLALDSIVAFKLDITGVDLLFDADQYIVREVNCAADFAVFEAATGLNLARAVLMHCLEQCSEGVSVAPVITSRFEALIPACPSC